MQWSRPCLLSLRGLTPSSLGTFLVVATAAPVMYHLNPASENQDTDGLLKYQTFSFLSLLPNSYLKKMKVNFLACWFLGMRSLKCPGSSSGLVELFLEAFPLWRPKLLTSRERRLKISQMGHWEPVYRGTPTSNLYLANSHILPIGDPVPCNKHWFRVDLESWRVVPFLTGYSLQASTSVDALTGPSSALSVRQFV